MRNERVRNGKGDKRDQIVPNMIENKPGGQRVVDGRVLVELEVGEGLVIQIPWHRLAAPEIALLDTIL